MHCNNLPKHFFKNNQLSEFSTAMLTHFRMITLTIADLNDQVADMVVPGMDEARLEKYQIEKDSIRSLNKAEDIIMYMRKIKEPQNSNILLEKALDYQDEVVPLVLNKIRTSGHDVFIENTAILLANADVKYTEQLYDIFHEIRNAYARSELCIVFGVKKKVEYTELLLEQYHLIKKERPDQDYEQGPLLALNLIYGK